MVQHFYLEHPPPCWYAEKRWRAQLGEQECLVLVEWQREMAWPLEVSGQKPFFFCVQKRQIRISYAWYEGEL
jgi:hypothetical protein